MMSRMEKGIRAVSFTFLLFVSILTTPICAMFTTLPILLFTIPFFEVPLQFRLHSKILTIWEAFVTGLLEFVAGIKIKTFGDAINPKDNCLYMMNHRTRLDWLYFWLPLLRMEALTHSRVILKADIKDFPPTCWGMQLVNFIFIHRNWEVDKVILSKTIDYFNNMKKPIQLLIFPEGTNFEKSTKGRSDAFAKKNNLPEYDYVLHPRTTGFTFLVEHMKNNNSFDAVYDITIAYPDTIPLREPDILLGKFPKEVHYHIKRYSAKDLPDDSESLEVWCKERWQEKEKQLESFYKVKHFDKPLAKTSKNEYLSFLALVLQILYYIVWFYLMWWSPVLLWYTGICSVLMTLFYVYARKYHGGVDFMLIDLYNTHYQGRLLKKD